jgi:ParB/RepB/Spo0J family partition protein
VPVCLIAPDPDHARRRVSEERLQLLAESIRACGVIHPVLIRPHPDAAARGATPFQLIVGGRRLIAAGRAGLAVIPVFLREQRLSVADRLMMQIAESDGELREELALIDVATAAARAFELCRCTQLEFAARYRRSQTWVANRLLLAQTVGVTREALDEDLIKGILAARTFLRLSLAQQRHLVDEARRSHVPIGLRRAERAARDIAVRRRRQPMTLGGRPVGDGGGDGAGEDLPRSPAVAQLDEAVDDTGGGTLHTGPWGSRPWAGNAPASGAPGRTARAAGGAPAAAGGPPDGTSSITVVFTFAQLETLLILLGQEPAGSLPEMVEQLYACL